jgi:hypothetical protein
MAMKIYNCAVNLGGPVLHLAPKENISAAEITLLLALHGDDSVRNIVETGEVNVSDGQLYDYLTIRYGDKPVLAAFGAKTRKLSLPDEIDLEALYAAPADEVDDEAPMMVDPTKAAMEAAAINTGNADRPARRETAPADRA